MAIFHVFDSLNRGRDQVVYRAEFGAAGKPIYTHFSFSCPRSHFGISIDCLTDLLNISATATRQFILTADISL